MEETSVSEKIDADLCPICLDVFFSTQDFLQHVQETYHISSKSNCSKTIKSCESDNMCPLCQDSVFGEPVNLLKHMFEKHSVSSKETCQKCLQDCIKTEAEVEKESLKSSPRRLSLFLPPRPLLLQPASELILRKGGKHWRRSIRLSNAVVDNRRATTNATLAVETVPFKCATLRLLWKYRHFFVFRLNPREANLDALDLSSKVGGDKVDKCQPSF